MGSACTERHGLACRHVLHLGSCASAGKHEVRSSHAAVATARASASLPTTILDVEQLSAATTAQPLPDTRGQLHWTLSASGPALRLKPCASRCIAKVLHNAMCVGKGVT